MSQQTVQSRVSHNCKMTETADASFKRKSRPFLFLANTAVLSNGWTPTALAEHHGIFDFGELSKVVVMVTIENFQHVLMLIEAWQEAGIAVILRFTNIRSMPIAGKGFAELDPNECYLPLTRDTFIASDALKAAVRDTFKNDKYVTVEG